MSLGPAFRFCVALFILAIALPQQGRGQEAGHRFRGVVEPAQQWNVASPIDGFIKSINFTEGQLVAKGDILVEFAPLVAELSLELAKAGYERAAATLEESEADLGRQRELRNREAISISAYSDVALKRELARIDLRTAELQLKLAEAHLELHLIHAPADGLISAPRIYEGSNYVAELSGPIATILQLDPIRVRVSLSLDRTIRNLQAGRFDMQAVKDMKFRLILPGGAEYSQVGSIVAIGTELDAKTGRGSALLEFANPSNLLRPGIPVEVVAVID